MEMAHGTRRTLRRANCFGGVTGVKLKLMREEFSVTVAGLHELAASEVEISIA